MILRREVKLTIEILQGALADDDDFVMNFKDSKLAKETIQVASHFYDDAYDNNEEYPKFLEFLENF